MYRPVLTKRDFVERYQAGEFGNRAPTWNSLEEWKRSGPLHGRLYHVRNRVASAKTWYNVPTGYVAAVWAMATEFYRADQLYISEMAPTEKTIFQGEVMRGPWGLYVYGSTVAKPMREALAARSVSLQGIMGVFALKHHLCPNSYDWLLELLERYPDHVIEFSSYSVEWGILSGFNTIFWEVRNY